MNFFLFKLIMGGKLSQNIAFAKIIALILNGKKFLFF